MGKTRSWQMAVVATGLCILTGCFNVAAAGRVDDRGPSGRDDAEVPPPPVNPFRADYVAASTARAALFERRRGFDNTEEEAMPSRGDVVYSGFGSVAVETAGTGFMLIGDATITARFQNARLDGMIDNFLGRTTPGTEAPYAGALIFSGETGGAAFRDNRFAGVVTGTLVGPSSTVLVNSDLSGGFRGEAYEIMFGTTDDDNTITVDGSSVVGTVQIIAER